MMFPGHLVSFFVVFSFCNQSIADGDNAREMRMIAEYGGCRCVAICNVCKCHVFRSGLLWKKKARLRAIILLAPGDLLKDIYDIRNVKLVRKIGVSLCEY